MGEAGRKLVWDGRVSPSGWPRPPRRSTASGWRSAAMSTRSAQRAGADVPRDAGRRHDRRHAGRVRGPDRAPGARRLPVAVGRSVRRLSGRRARARAFGADHLRRRLPEQLGPRASGAGAPRHARRPVHHHRLDRRWPRPAACGQGGRCPPRRTTTPASSWSPPAAPTRSCCAGARSRPARRRHASNSIPIPTRTRAGTRNAPATSRPSAPASPTSCGCRARRWPAAWAASATTCAGRRAISTPTTWRRRARPASGTCTLPTLSARTRPARIPSTSTASRCAIAAAPGSTGASGCRATVLGSALPRLESLEKAS